jgi:hypothetical protein
MNLAHACKCSININTYYQRSLNRSFHLCSVRIILAPLTIVVRITFSNRCVKCLAHSGSPLPILTPRHRRQPALSGAPREDYRLECWWNQNPLACFWCLMFCSAQGGLVMALRFSDTGGLYPSMIAHCQSQALFISPGTQPVLLTCVFASMAQPPLFLTSWFTKTPFRHSCSVACSL